jgi:hypothetical protein
MKKLILACFIAIGLANLTGCASERPASTTTTTEESSVVNQPAQSTTSTETTVQKP